MTKKYLTLLTTVVLTALILAGCGRTRDSVVESSAPEGINTFGVEVHPSTQPSTGQVLPETSTAVTVTDPSVTGGDTFVVETTTAPAVSPVPSSAPSTAPSSPTPSKTPSSGSSTAPPQPSASDEALPSPSGIAPPAPVSSSSVDDVMKYIGKTPKELIEDHGYPSSSVYDYVDEKDPDAGEIGTMYYPTFTVSTLRKDGTETITSVTPKATPTPPEVSPAE